MDDNINEVRESRTIELVIGAVICLLLGLVLGFILGIATVVEGLHK